MLLSLTELICDEWNHLTTEKVCFYVTAKDNDEKLIMKPGYRKSEDKILFVIPEKSVVYAEFTLFEE